MKRVIAMIIILFSLISCGENEQVNRIVKQYDEAGLKVQNAKSMDEVQGIALETCSKALDNIDPEINITTSQKEKIFKAINTFGEIVNKKLDELEDQESREPLETKSPLDGMKDSVETNGTDI